MEFNLGIRVKDLLKSKNVKPSDFCKEMGISSQNFYDWQKKGSSPNAMTALKVAQYLGVTVEYLLTGKDFQTLSEERSELVETTYKKKYENLKKSILKIAEEN